MAHIDAAKTTAAPYSFRDVIEEVISEVRSWNARRRTVSELSRLSRSQLADIGLDGVDIDDLARRMAR